MSETIWQRLLSPVAEHERRATGYEDVENVYSHEELLKLFPEGYLVHALVMRCREAAAEGERLTKENARLTQLLDAARLGVATVKKESHERFLKLERAEATARALAQALRLARERERDPYSAGTGPGFIVDMERYAQYLAALDLALATGTEAKEGQ